MPLSSEDQLRIQVMFHNNPEAIRIDENRMVLYALTQNGEASIPLSPNCTNDNYIKELKGMLAEYTLGSSGGYPIYLKRWSRMGDTEGSHLQKFLLLGEPEAVVAVANSPALTIDLAHKAWWAVTNTAEQSEQGLQMLCHECVVKDSLGVEIAEYLMEYLPFLVNEEKILATLSTVLQDGLLSEERVTKIWERSQDRGKGIYQIAFLQARVNSLPINSIDLSLELLDKVSNETSVYALLNAIGISFSSADPVKLALNKLILKEREYSEFTELIDIVDNFIADESVKYESGNYNNKTDRSELILSQLNEKAAFSYILHSGSVGRSLRKKSVSTV